MFSITYFLVVILAILRCIRSDNTFTVAKGEEITIISTLGPPPKNAVRFGLIAQDDGFVWNYSPIHCIEEMEKKAIEMIKTGYKDQNLLKSVVISHTTAYGYDKVRVCMGEIYLVIK